ncbi:MAG: hypothetical protein U0572_18350 [Phycisphaerales bacterium]
MVIAVALMTATRALAGDAVTCDPPQPMKATLANGKTIAGAIARWDDAGFEGAIGRYRWDDFKPIEAYRVRKKLIEPLGDARRGRMIELVAWCWSVGDERLADRAADDARRWGAQDAELARAQADGAARKAERAAQAERAEREKLRTRSPEAESFKEGLWPAVSDADRPKHVQELRAEVTTKLAAAGREATPIDSRHALIYSDLGAVDASRRGADVDDFVGACLAKLGLPKESLPFWGKLVVVVADNADRFRLLEASAFRQLANADDTVFTHYDGPKAFVIVYARSDPTGANLDMWRGVAQAFLHRYLSATRPPPWANEGLADWLVASFPKGRGLDEPLRKAGLAFLRGGGSLEQVVDMTYDGAWPGKDGIGRAVGYLLVGLMIEQEPARFRKFIAAVKQGKPWKQAMADDFGVPLPQFLDVARRYYRTND